MDAFDNLLNSMKQTAGSRFAAAKRLEARDRHLGWVTAITSVYIIFLTALPYVKKLPAAVTEDLNLAILFLSIVILATSLLHNSNKDAVNAEQLHRSALEINELYRKILVGRAAEDEIDLMPF